MNLTILRALFEDAKQQVLDNKVFRLLLLLTAVPILFTFLVGFHEEGISFLWGWREVSYKDFLSGFGGAGRSSAEEMSAQFIQAVQSVTLGIFVGSLGMMLCIAATAFFAPRILEKGSADTLFSKPVSRMTILLSRYLAGILFVAFISGLLVVGMYLGFWMNSGYNDPGFLWGALTLVYLYAMMHAFSMVVAVFTKSSTAAILLTITLFMVCGAVHGGWVSLEYAQQQKHMALLRAGGDGEEGTEEKTGIIKTLIATLNVLHYTLPKTSDADIITMKLRRALTEKDPVIATKDGDFVMKLGPEGFTVVEGTEDQFESSGVEWTPDSSEDLGADTVRVRRYKRPEIEKKIGSRTRLRALTSKDASRARVKELESAGASVESEDTKLSSVRTLRLTWTAQGEELQHRDYFLHFGDWMYEIQMTGSAQALASEQGRNLRRNFLGRGNIVLGNIAGKSPEAWYRDAFRWDAELKYNLFFSIGSSLAFILLMLGIAWARLQRIDF